MVAAVFFPCAKHCSNAMRASFLCGEIVEPEALLDVDVAVGRMVGCRAGRPRLQMREYKNLMT